MPCQLVHQQVGGKEMKAAQSAPTGPDVTFKHMIMHQTNKTGNHKALKDMKAYVIASDSCELLSS
jgi:hypothetical protein